MKIRAIVLLSLFAVAASAEPAFVSDDLILGVYSEKNQQGTRLTTLHSGASVDVLTREGEFAQVGLGNDKVGWVKASFLTTREPAAVRVKSLEAELARIRSSTPAMAEAAARSELETLKQQLAARQKEVDALQSASPAAAATAAPSSRRGDSIGIVIITGLLCTLAGFVLGYATLARRIREKFGGVKVF
jgi:uncharacterized protein YgiM (DUF1202 family)